MKCSQKDCENEASYSFVWGQDSRKSYICLEGLLKLIEVAKVLGFDPQIESLSEEKKPTY